MPAKPGSEFDNVARGGSTRWNGKGPKPARHIPWPEIFKHHISVVEGHQRMIDMIRKHTVEGTGNHRTIMACLERANQMLRDTKEATRNFVPPNDRDAVPIGSASDSMYVGYSPADHHYGEAAEKYGMQAVLAKKRGAEVLEDSNGPEYKVGQSHGVAKKSLKEIREAQKAQNIPRFANGANNVPVAERTQPKEPVADAEANRYFFMDSNPVPATTTKASNGESADSEDRPAKRSKLSAEPEAGPVLPAEGEKEDIDAEVDARLAEKQRKRKEKKEKREKKDNKRKRESDAADVELPKDEDAMEIDSEEKVEKPKEKKSKKSKDAKNSAGDTEVVTEDADGEKPKKKSKKSKATGEENDKKREADAEDEEDEESKPKKKKSKKDKKGKQ